MRLLVVEDESKLRQTLSQGLREAGYAVDAVGSGEEALSMAATAPYDLVLLDVLLPGKDGFAVCRELRTRGVTAPVLMLTALDAVEDRVKGLDLGADDYLPKPFALSELLARIRALLRRRGASPPGPLRVEDLTLDPVTHRVLRGGKAVLLTAREYSLLAYLMRHAGEVVSRSDLLGHVWDADFDGNPNAVEVYISYLRAKVDKGFPQKLIHTVRGMGYRLAGGPDGT
ncbi:MAG TPA: response regulator transcription factor [Armatimonadota bacterium]